jgi:O-methyltransferase
MISILRDRARRLLHPFGLHEPPLHFTAPLPFWCAEMARAHRTICRRVCPYTMTSPERVAALCQGIAHLERAQIAGAIVECGVWRGGSMMAAALALLRLGSTCRQLFLFDTFQGMPPPTPVDVDWRGRSAVTWLNEKGAEAERVRACCPLQETRAALGLTRYPWEKIIFIAGRVEETLPREAPERIALLRLDTDWYESTRHELETLYPRLVEGGLLIVDDYGHWQGARRAVDEYFARHEGTIELHPIDYTGRLIIKRVAHGHRGLGAGPHRLHEPRRAPLAAKPPSAG